jgi:hypothetical protein
MLSMCRFLFIGLSTLAMPDRLLQRVIYMVVQLFGTINSRPCFFWQGNTSQVAGAIGRASLPVWLGLVLDSKDSSLHNSPHRCLNGPGQSPLPYGHNGRRMGLCKATVPWRDDRCPGCDRPGTGEEAPRQARGRYRLPCCCSHNAAHAASLPTSGGMGYGLPPGVFRDGVPEVPTQNAV